MSFLIQLQKLILLFVLFILFFSLSDNPCLLAQEDKEMISLPEPKIKGTVSLEEVINQRRSVRDFSSKTLIQDEISQLLWVGQGITEKNYSLRAVPSAGALYPLEIYIFTENGLMHYLPHKHSLEFISKEDLRKDLARVSLGQAPVAKAALDIVICAVYERVTGKYSDRGVRYVHMEAGHAGQNIHLMAVSLGLGSVSIGAFDDAKVQKLLRVDKDVKPLYIIPVGNIEK